MTKTELKAAAYDALAAIEFWQGQLKLINDQLRNSPPELTQLAAPAAEPPAVVTEEKIPTPDASQNQEAAS